LTEGEEEATRNRKRRLLSTTPRAWAAEPPVPLTTPQQHRRRHYASARALRRAGIESVILEHSHYPPSVQIVRRWPPDNALASFLMVYLKDEHDSGCGANLAQTGPTRLEPQIEALLQEKITGRDYDDPDSDEYEDDHNPGCIMMFESPQDELPKEVKKAACRILVDGIKRLIGFEDKNLS
jgi:hypothetical protein